jgi:hypothetical protein
VRDRGRYAEPMSSEIHNEVPARGSAVVAAAQEGGPSEAGPSEEEGSVNYDESPLIELEIEGIDYRLDAGRAGTALCISTRTSGSWGWVFRGEARWQAKVLRCKAFDRTVLLQLATALAEAAADLD